MSEEEKQRQREYQKNYREPKKLWFLVKQYINFMDLIVYALFIYY